MNAAVCAILGTALASLLPASLAASLAESLPAPPRISVFSRLGGQRGTEVAVTVYGARLRIDPATIIA